MSRWLTYRVRWLDRPAALLISIVLCLPMALVAIVVLIGDGRPVFVKLPRVGRKGELLQLVKFRTMRQPAGATRALGSSLTVGADARVTPIGRWLRGRRLDELPQLLNVVRGEMALLGPRPEAPEYVERSDPRWERVLASLPGIAGPTQIIAQAWEADLPDGPKGVAYYQNELLPVKLAIDAWYVGSASPLVDLRILLALARLSLEPVRAMLPADLMSQVDAVRRPSS